MHSFNSEMLALGIFSIWLNWILKRMTYFVPQFDSFEQFHQSIVTIAAVMLNLIEYIAIIQHIHYLFCWIDETNLCSSPNGLSDKSLFFDKKQPVLVINGTVKMRARIRYRVCDCRPTKAYCMLFLNPYIYFPLII